MWWRRLTNGGLYSHRTVKRQARKDGRDWRWTIWPFRKAKNPQPQVDQESVAEFELTLKDVAEDELATIANDWQEEDEQLRENYCAALTELVQAREADREESSEKSNATKAYERAKERLSKFESPRLSRLWMLVWLSLIGVGEFFLNSTVFQVLGTGRGETYLAALAVGVAIPMIGHWMGEALRQEEKSRTDWALIWTAPAALLVGLYGLTFLRGKFAEALGVEFRRVLGVELSSEEFMWVFFSLNVLLFVVAVLLSFAGSHKRASKFKRAQQEKKAAAEALEEESAEAAAAASRLEQAEQEYQRARIRRQKRYQSYRHDALDLAASAEVLSRIYREENVRARPDGRPKCFDREVPAESLTLPEALQEKELHDWDCPDAPLEVQDVAEREVVQGATADQELAV